MVLLAKAAGLNSTGPIKQGLGQQVGGFVLAAGLHSTLMHPPTMSAAPPLGQQKAAESAPAQQPAWKKQKGSELDERIDQLNDVTAVSGINLKEEAEQLLIEPKVESLSTKAMRKFAQEEDEKLFLERGPLRTKVAAIATRFGVTEVSEDLGTLLSMSVEERLRSILYRLIKLSKQRCDVDKERAKVVITSDVRSQLLRIKRKSLCKKLAEESELNEEKNEGPLSELEKEKLKAKAQKAQKEEEDRQVKAANVATRAAVGTDDMLLKWQVMAAQGRKKRQEMDVGAAKDGATQTGVSLAGVSASHSEKKPDNGDSARAGHRNAKRAITVKDVISFLEMEPQMSKSTLLYRLSEKDYRRENGLPAWKFQVGVRNLVSGEKKRDIW